MQDMKTIPLDRKVFCRLKSTGKLVIAQYKPYKKCFEVVRDEIYDYKKDDFSGWFELYKQGVSDVFY